MYLKLMGCIGTIVATSGYGYSKGLEYQKQIDDLGELRSVMLQLAAEMQYTGAPLSQVCMAVAQRSSRICQNWLQNLSKDLEKSNTWKPGEKRRLAKIWEEGCKTDLNNLMIGREEEIRLYEMGRQLGSLNKEMEGKIFLQYAEFLEEKRRKLLETVSEKRRLCNLLGVAAGIFLVIVIL